MNRKDFMGRLEGLLMDIPAEERVEAMAFYHGYFEDAGLENEERVLRELESPEKVAASIKAEMNLGSSQEKAEGEDWGSDIRMGNGPAQEENGYTRMGNGSAWVESRDRKKDDSLNTVLFVLLAVLTSPLWLTALIGVLSVLLGLFGTTLGFTLVVVGLYIAGVALFAVSIAAFGAGAVPAGFGLLGGGFLMLAVALLATVLCVLICGRFFPWAVKGIISLCKRVFSRKAKGGYAS